MTRDLFRFSFSALALDNERERWGPEAGSFSSSGSAESESQEERRPVKGVVGEAVVAADWGEDWIASSSALEAGRLAEST